MAKFSYVVIEQNGKEKKGSIDAASVEQATALLKNNGQILVSVEQASALQSGSSKDLFEKKPKPRDLAVLCRQFVSISSAGVPVTAAFEMLAEQTENKILAKAVGDVCGSIRSGSSLSESMMENANIFTNLMITMVGSGEASGNLELAFGRMGEQFEKDARLRALVRRSSIYPAVIVVVSIIVIMVMLGYVVPQFESVLSGLGAELPLLTQIVVAAGDFMQSSWIFVAIALIGGFFLLRFYAQKPGGKRLFGKIQLKLPIFGKLVTKTAAARTCRTMATLISAGIPMIDALEIVAKTMDNVYFEEALLAARDDVAMGTPLSEPLTRCGLFPPLVCHMTKIGEEVGDLEGMFTKLADYYDEEVEATTAAVMAAIEPMIIILLALIIGTIVLAIILPMTELYASLDTL